VAEPAPPRPCDLLLTGGILLEAVPGQVGTPPTPGAPPVPAIASTPGTIRDGAVAIDSGRIVAVGPSAALRQQWRGARQLDARGGIVLPGLINLHTHLAMTVFRGLADDLPLDRFLSRVWAHERRVMSPEVVELAVTAAVVESQRCGVTTALDMYFHHDVAAAVADRLHFRLVTGPAITYVAPKDLLQVVDAAAAWLATDPGPLALRRCLAPHSTYTLTPEVLTRLGELAATWHPVVHVHAAETEREVAEVTARHGVTPLAILDHSGLLGPSTVVAHAVAVSPPERRRLAETGASVAHCPQSNAKLASGVCAVPELQAEGVCVGLGTDGPASSNDLGLLPTMRLTALLQKLRLGDATAMAASEVVQMATVHGAAALGLSDRLGTLEPGKLADLLVFDARTTAAHPDHDPCSSVLYSLGKAEVRHVVVGGQLVVDEGRSCYCDEETVAQELATLLRRLAIT